MFLVNYTNLKENQFFSDYREKRKKKKDHMAILDESMFKPRHPFGPKRLYGAAGFFI
jgi:hypothetical protein